MPERPGTPSNHRPGPPNPPPHAHPAFASTPGHPAPGSASQARSTERPVRAIVLARTETDLAPLRASLARRGVEAEWFAGPFAALAAACRPATSPGPNAGPNTGRIVILAEPARWPAAADIIRAFRRYAPRAVCWMYAALPSPRLEAIQHEHLLAWDRGTSPAPTPATALPPPAASPAPHTAPAPPAPWTTPTNRPTPAHAPALRLIDDRESPPAAKPAPVPAPPPARVEPLPAIEPAASADVLLTEDELAVLLGEPEDFDQPGSSTPAAPRRGLGGSPGGGSAR
jgi:hypothetical protein